MKAELQQMSGRHLGEGREGEVEGRGMYIRSSREGVGVGNCLNYVCMSVVLLFFKLIVLHGERKRKVGGLL